MATYQALQDAETAGQASIGGVLVVKTDADNKVHIQKMTDRATKTGVKWGAVGGLVLGILLPPIIIAGTITASAAFCVYRITRGGTDPEVVSSPRLAGIPDSSRWSADGKTLLAGVHTEDPVKFAEAQAAAVKIGGSMFTTFNVTRMNAGSMKTEVVMPSRVHGAFGVGTGAIEVGKRLWVSSTKSDRIGIFDLNP